MKFSWLHTMSISTLCSSCSFETSGSTWTQFQTQCNLWKRTNKLVSYKVSEAARLNNLFCLCLVLKLSRSMAQPHCCWRLTHAEISGIEDSRCVWRPPSLHEIILIAYDVHLHFVLLMLFWKIWSYLNPIPNSVQPMKTDKQAGLIQVIWGGEIKQSFLPLSGSQALQINGVIALLLKADTGWDKWHWG